VDRRRWIAVHSAPTVIAMWEIIVKFIVDNFGAIAHALERLFRRTGLLAVLCCVLLAGAGILLFWYYQRSKEYTNIVNSTLHADVEPTPQESKGLEAFILSSLDRSTVNTFKGEILNQDFVQKYSALVGIFTATNKAELGKEDVTLAAAGGATEKNKKRILTDSKEPGFLFLPLDLIRGAHPTTDAPNLSTQEIVTIGNTLLRKDETLKRDVILSRRVAKLLDELLGTAFVANTGANYPLDIKPVQVYMITGTGVNRIFSTRLSNSYYGTQFSPQTFFPGRPYFLGALKKVSTMDPIVDQEKTAFGGQIPSEPRVGSTFYVSQPYMDLGGNGIVITASREIRNYNFGHAVVCLDFQLAATKDLTKVLLDTIEKFDAPWAQVQLAIDRQHSSVLRPNIVKSRHTPPNGDENELAQHAKARLDKETQDFSSFFGNIEKISDQDSNISAESIVPMEVSVPVGAVKLENDVQSGEFLLFKLDLAAFRQKTDWIGLLGCTCLGIFTVFLIGGFVVAVSHSDDLAETNTELHEAFAKVGTVLWDAPVAYALLDAGDQIKDCNLAMCKLLGFREKQELVGREFRTLVWPDDQLNYDHVQEKRKKRKPVESYPLRFTSPESKPISMWIVSASVPSPSELHQDSLPETFGIMLSEQPSAQRLQVVDRAKVV
jgi:PAS domain-containing protein